MQPQAFYRAVADDFSAVDGIIKKQLTSKVPLVSKIGDYITSAGGKRLRPLLVLLCGKALGRQGDDLRLLAATIEFLHTATLLHDDVVDMSGMRRGRETANYVRGGLPPIGPQGHPFWINPTQIHQYHYRHVLPFCHIRDALPA